MDDNKNQSVTKIDPTSLYEPMKFTDEIYLEKLKKILPMIEQQFAREVKNNYYPGFIYGIIIGEKLFHTHSFGYINIEKKISPTTNSLFRIASMTKSFTAMAIVKLRDDGKLRLDDSINQYIPEFQRTNLLTTDAPIITIRHLLIQYAGMPEDDPWADRQLSLPDDEFLTLLNKGMTMSNPPGIVWEYTNLGYAMLGRIITVVSQMPYQQYIKQEILNPLGMTNTYWEYSEIPSERLAHGYRWECERYSEEKLLHDGTFGAMGGLITSIEDFSKYISYHLQAWPPRDEPEYGPLRRSSLREMHHPWNFIDLETSTSNSSTAVKAYCYGLVWSKNNDGIVSINHSGGLPGFGCNWVMLPEYGIGIISFANRTYADLCHINTTTLLQIIKHAELKPRKLLISKYLAERKEQLIKVILYNKWNINDAQISTMFAENFFLDHSLELRKKVSDELFNELGDIFKIDKLIPKNQLRGYFNIHGKNGRIQIRFSLSPENPPLIQELYLLKH